MTLTTAPYLAVRMVQRRLMVKDLACPRRIPIGFYRVAVGERWVAMDDAELRFSTGGRPNRKMEFVASGAAAAALMDLEATLRGSGGPVQLADEALVVFDIAGTPLGSSLHLGGDFLIARDPEWFPFRIILPDITTIHGFARDQVGRDMRVLSLDHLRAADELALIQAVVTSPTPLVVERIS